MILTGTLRDVWMKGTEPVLVLDHPRVEGKIIREHLNIRQRDLLKASISGDLKIGSTLRISADLGQYMHNGMAKACLVNIRTVKTI